jgi:hypothetical protein
LIRISQKQDLDGLARLPPVRLISEDSQEGEDDGPLNAKPNLSDTPVLDNTVNPPEPPAADSAVPASKTKPVPPPLNLDAPKLHVPPPPKEPTPVSGDVLFPLIIFSVVKANPAHLVSNLLFTQRFRNQTVGGEESYCLINMMAVAEFLENVDMGALGLDNTDKVLRWVFFFNNL